MAILSIIIPVYNKEKYLDECLHSIMNQTFKEFELILINDGSTDGSGAKCEQYKNNNDNVVVLHQENQGVSSARNRGIAIATGEYIGFIDADDRIEENMYELLVNNALNTDSDISVCRLSEAHAKHSVSGSSHEIKVLDRNQALVAFFKGDLDYSANNKIYKRQIAKSIRFEGRMFEDVLFTFRALSMSSRIVVAQDKLYHYVLRENSVSISKFSEKYLEPVGVTQKILNSLATTTKEITDHARVFDFVMNLSLFNLIALADKKKYSNEYNMVVNRLNEYEDLVNNSGLVRRKHKIAYAVFKTSPLVYSIGLKLYFLAGRSLAGKRV